jgi:hypothetical protein
LSVTAHAWPGLATHCRARTQRPTADELCFACCVPALAPQRHQQPRVQHLRLHNRAGLLLSHQQRLPARLVLRRRGRPLRVVLRVRRRRRRARRNLPQRVWPCTSPSGKACLHHLQAHLTSSPCPRHSRYDQKARQPAPTPSRLLAARSSPPPLACPMTPMITVPAPSGSWMRPWSWRRCSATRWARSPPWAGMTWAWCWRRLAWTPCPHRSSPTP